ncbi:MAG TPA: hypothetical protein VFD57_05490, partial [Clostridia bacterium]|nr:hypothetical protein [Clostridia bacterium]
MREKGIANNIIGSIIDYYRNMKIRNRLLLLLFSTVLLVCLISLLLLNFVIYKYNNLLYNEASQVLNLSTAGIENAIKKVEDISFNILADSRIQEHAIEIQNSENAYDRFRELRTLSERIMAFISNESKIISAVFIDGQGNEAVSGNYPRSLNEDTKKHVLAKAAEEKGGFTIIDPSVDDISLIYARQIRSVKDLLLEPLGTLIFRVEFKQLVQKNLNISSQYDLNLLIYYKDQNIYPPDKTGIVSSEDFSFKNNSGYEISNIAGKKYFIAYTKSKYTGFTY